ncbi:MAG: homogentisate 1,2-dioxygenase [Sandaracinaceae bacterium]
MLDRMMAGEVPAKHHIALKAADGQLRWEECLTRDGFEGPYTILYHLHRPHEQRRSETKHGFALPAAADPILAKRHFRSQDLSAPGAPVDARVPLLFNDDVVVSVLTPSVSDPVYFVNGDADDLFYVHAGGGLLRTVLGDVRFEAEDYVFVPRGVLHRFILDEGPQHWLSLECKSGLGLPKQWRNPVGQLRMDAPFCHRDFRRPTFEGPNDEGIREMVVKQGDRFHGFTVDNPPLDVVGWDGTVYPWAFPILNFQPRAGLVHLPPTWHGTFAVGGALVCSFVPRMVDWHDDAIPCPYPHSSVDVDEMLFYCRGNFTSRKGVGPGSVSFHPHGIPHGPHPGSYEASMGHKRTDEMAVMLDCIKPLRVTTQALDIEHAEYHDSFVET